MVIHSPAELVFERHCVALHMVMTIMSLWEEM